VVSLWAIITNELTPADLAEQPNKEWRSEQGEGHGDTAGH
jgi:hypothetical protein